MPEPSPGGAAGSTAPRTRGAGDPAPRDEPEAKRRREASNIVIQEITDELRTFGAVVGPKFTRCAPQEAEGIEVNQLDLKDAVVSEIFCKNRFASNAPSFGLHPGFAIDHTTEWDFGEPAQEADVQAQRDRATQAACPECKTWGQLQNLSKYNQLFEVNRKHFSRHMEAVAHMYHGQVDDHNYSLHEHSEVSLRFLLRFQKRDDVHWIRNDLCATGLTVKKYPARKVTGWLTNSRCIEDALDNFHCENRTRTQPKHHCQDKLVLAILKGVRTQLQVDGKMEVCSVRPHVTTHDDEPIDEEEIAKFYGDVTAEMLPGHLLRAARQEEIKFLNTFPVYKKVPPTNAKGKERVSVRWCDVNKGDSNNMGVRSRLVGRESWWKDPFMQGTFASTPPLESLRYVLHWVQTCRRRYGRKLDITLLVLDVSPAHFRPPAVREPHITLPEEDATPAMVGQLLRTLYGTRDAAHEWDAFAKKNIAAVEYHVGLSSPCIYVTNTEPSLGWRHGDDILFAGEEKVVDEIFDKLKCEMVLTKRANLEFAENDDKHCTILHRLIDFKMNENGHTILCAQDPGHVELLLEHVELDGTNVKGVGTPGEKSGMYKNEPSSRSPK